MELNREDVIDYINKMAEDFVYIDSEMVANYVFKYIDKLEDKFQAIESENKELKEKLEAYEKNKVEKFNGILSFDFKWVSKVSGYKRGYKIQQHAKDDETYTVTISKETKDDEKTR